MIRKTSVLVALALLVSTATFADNPKPPFKWDSAFASPGTSLELVESMRNKSPMGTLLLYSPKSTGFPKDKPLVFWVNYGSDYIRFDAKLDENGVVRVASFPDGIAMAGPVKGQALDVALAVADTDVHAQFKIIPFPIEAKGNGKCTASAEIISPSGDLFGITFGGFEPGETVETTSTYRKENRSATQKASDAGEVMIAAMHARRARGMASATAHTEQCTVTVEYAVGRDALAPQ